MPAHDPSPESQEPSSGAPEGAPAHGTPAHGAPPERGEAARDALLADAGLIVHELDAFRGFAPAGAYDEVRAALGRRRRPAPVPYRGPKHELLRHVVCAEPRGDGRLCGRRIPARYGVRAPDRYRYHSENCYAARPPHGASFPPFVENAVVDVMATVLAPAVLAEAVRALKLQAGDEKARIRLLERRHADVVAQEGAAARRSLKAEAERQPAAAARWETERVALEAEAAGFAAELAALRASAAGTVDRRIEVLERVSALAADLPALLAAARVIPGLAQAVVAACVSRVALRRLSGGVCEVAVTFPSGDVARRLVLTEPVRVTQPVLAYVAERVASGVAPDVVAAALNAANPAPRGDRRWDADRVLTAEYQARVFAPVTPLRGAGEPIPALAARLGVDEADALRAAFAGTLGPARVEAGVVHVHPTRAQVHRGLPAVALCDVARDLGCNKAELVLLRAVLGATDTTLDERLALARRLTVARDDAGRLYGRVTEVAAATGAAAAGRPRRSTKKARSNGAVVSIAAVPAPADLAQAELARAVAALPGPPRRPADFVPREDLLQQLRGRFGFPSRTALLAAIAAGAVPEVRARGVGLDGRRLPAQYHTWCPRAVREGTLADVRAWLAPPPEAAPL